MRNFSYVLYNDNINIYLPDRINLGNDIQVFLYDISGRLINSEFTIVDNNVIAISPKGLKNIGILYIKSSSFNKVIKIVGL